MYARETSDGTELTLASAGWTYDNTFVLWNTEDPEKESMWYHIPGTNSLFCIGGHYAGEVLDEIPSALLRWNEWVIDHPGSKFMDRQR